MQQGNASQPQYHHQQTNQPAQMLQYQAQPQYGIAQHQQPQYGINPGMHERPRQTLPNEQNLQNIYTPQQLQQLQASLPQNVLYHQQQIQNHYSLHPAPRSPPTGHPQSIMSSQQQMHQQSHAPSIYSQNNAAAIMSGAATLRRPPPNAVRDPMEGIPNSNMIDTAMFERDKQIYKCSTMRQGGKYDPRNFGPRPNITNGVPMNAPQPKPSILNCPLPEIPKDHGNNGIENVASPKNLTNNNPSNMNQPAMTR